MKIKSNSGTDFSFTEVRQVTGRLQNGVGDLKAEWLLIKREVQDLKSENIQLKLGHNDMKDDAIKLKQRIEDIWGEMQKLRVCIINESHNHEFWSSL